MKSQAEKREKWNRKKELVWHNHIVYERQNKEIIIHDEIRYSEAIRIAIDLIQKEQEKCDKVNTRSVE